MDHPEAHELDGAGGESLDADWTLDEDCVAPTPQESFTVVADQAVGVATAVDVAAVSLLDSFAGAVPQPPPQSPAGASVVVLVSLAEAVAQPPPQSPAGASVVVVVAVVVVVHDS